MLNYIGSRLMQMVITLFVVSLIVFFLVRLKGDPVSIMAPPTFTVEQRERLRELWGFDQPLWRQYVVFVSNAVTGDFGQSIQHQRPAMELVLERLMGTYVLAGVSALIGLAVALPLGVLAALNRNSIIDLVSTMFATVGTAMPSFWLGLMLILLFSVQWRILPAFGRQEPKALIMPAVTLGIGMAAQLSRLTRSAVLEVLNEDYVRTARCKGIGETAVILRHVIPNALIPVVTAFGIRLGWLLGGSVVIEAVFAWPGLGRLMVESIRLRDITVVQAGLLWFALSFILINLLIDVLYTLLDPRIRYD